MPTRWLSRLKTKPAGLDYVPLATSNDARHSERAPSDDVVRDDAWVGIERELSQRRSRSPRLTPRNAVYALLVLVVFAFPFVLMSSADTLPDPYPSELASPDPYFHTGDIWVHNDAVAARLDRCASLGLLRNMSLPQPLLPPEQEARYAAEGCGRNETTVVIVASLYFAEAFIGSDAGEDIWAQSTMSALNSSGYAFMFSSLGWWNHDQAKTMEIWKRYRDNVRVVLADPEQVELCYGGQKDTCLRSETNPEGIDGWRMLSFWYWDDPRHPLGARFTLSPTQNGHRFISYSIEPVCQQLRNAFVNPLAVRARRRRVYLLAKQIAYLDPKDWRLAWTVQALHDVARAEKIQFSAGLRGEGYEWLWQEVKDAGIASLGRLNKVEFYKELASSGVLLGVGQPRISPSPWDGLCLGVPFINPILSWDEADPSNRTAWKLQQWRMAHLGPPHVYPVHIKDYDELRATLHAALTTPIEPFIPEVMRYEHVRGLVAGVVEFDWEEEARIVHEEREREREEEQGRQRAAEEAARSESESSMGEGEGVDGSSLRVAREVHLDLTR